MSLRWTLSRIVHFLDNFGSNLLLLWWIKGFLTSIGLYRFLQMRQKSYNFSWVNNKTDFQCWAFRLRKTLQSQKGPKKQQVGFLDLIPRSQLESWSLIYLSASHSGNRRLSYLFHVNTRSIVHSTLFLRLDNLVWRQWNHLVMLVNTSESQIDY